MRLVGLVALLLALLSALLPASPAQGQSVGISPGSMEVEDAFRGTEYTELLLILNDSNRPVTFRLGATGEAGPWITFAPEGQPDQTIERVRAPANQQTRVLVKIRVPADAPNRAHTAEIDLTEVTSTAPGDDDGGGAGVNRGFSVSVSVNVTGTQRLAGNVFGAAVPDTEVGLPLRALAEFENTGNVVAEPEMLLVVRNEAGQEVGRLTKGDFSVAVGASDDLRAEWDTTGQQVGSYRVRLAVRLGGETIFSEVFNVRLEPEGFFTRRGELDSLTLTNAPQPGELATLVATFTNTGQIETVGAFRGQVYRDDVLVDTVESEELLVLTNEQVDFELFVPVPERGVYTVRGAVNYEGRETNERSIEFKVPPDLGSGGLFETWQIIAAAAIVAVLIIAAVFEARRRMRAGRSEP